MIESESVTEDVYPNGIVYSVKGGKLPAGLTLAANGEIEGVPTETGEFTVEINIAATYTAGSGWSRYNVTDNYEYEVTLTVEE